MGGGVGLLPESSISDYVEALNGKHGKIPVGAMVEWKREALNKNGDLCIIFLIDIHMKMKVLTLAVTQGFGQ